VRVSSFSLKTKVNGFSRFGLKTDDYGSCGLTSKPLARVSRFEPQNQQLRFVDLAHKITTTVSWFGPQNSSKLSELWFIGCTTKPMGE
jgi:hypothetical protein